MQPIIHAYKGISPIIADDAFIAPGAAVIGNTHIGSKSSIWYACVVRGDENKIRIGDNTNIQDGTVVHITSKTHGTFIGNNVTVGHSALIHGCTLEDGAFVGMKATVMDGCVVETGGMLAAGSLLTPGKAVKAGQLWSGSPARYTRDLTDEEQAYFSAAAGHYVEMAQQFRRDLGWTE